MPRTGYISSSISEYFSMSGSAMESGLSTVISWLSSALSTSPNDSADNSSWSSHHLVRRLIQAPSSHPVAFKLLIHTCGFSAWNSIRSGSFDSNSTPTSVALTGSLASSHGSMWCHYVGTDYPLPISNSERSSAVANVPGPDSASGSAATSQSLVPSINTQSS
ncbi:hypothetical protein JCM33374_g6591 [Metschnikowia sp. JCM 33374]|nr:hypothetical protein JCM33374_g6591 [Metschnikowia sp. JCM 33374]